MLSFLWRRLLAGLATLFVSTFVMYLLVSASMDPFYDLRQSTAPNKAAAHRRAHRAARPEHAAS